MLLKVKIYVCLHIRLARVRPSEAYINWSWTELSNGPALEISRAEWASFIAHCTICGVVEPVLASLVPTLVVSRSLQPSVVASLVPLPFQNNHDD